MDAGERLVRLVDAFAAAVKRERATALNQMFAEFDRAIEGGLQECEGDAGGER